MDGNTTPEFQPLAELLDKQVADAGRGGAAVTVYHHGEKVADVWTGAMDADGTPWREDTIAMSYSTTKGVTSTALHMCVDRGLLDYDDLVVEHWPEFGQNGKDAITVRQILCHEAGLYPIRSLIDNATVMNDWDAMVHALEAAAPAFEPGTANGYHGLTFGWLVGELVRRCSGKTITEFVASEIAEPLGCDGLYIGLPDSETGRVAELLFPTGGSIEEVEMAEEAGTLASTSASNAIVEVATQMGLEIDVGRIVEALMPHGMGKWVKDPNTLRAAIPAANGCFTARSLARMYSVIAAGGSADIEGRRVQLMSPETIARASEVQNTRPDLIIVMPMMWRLGYHPAFTMRGTLDTSIGHSGFGGSGAWADPSRELALGLTVNRIAGSAVGDTRIAELNSAALKCAKDAS